MLGEGAFGKKPPPPNPFLQKLSEKENGYV